VAHLDDVEVVDHQRRVTEMHTDGLGVTPVRVEGDHADAGQPAAITA
jgi:hypothetical protein